MNDSVQTRYVQHDRDSVPILCSHAYFITQHIYASRVTRCNYGSIRRKINTLPPAGNNPGLTVHVATPGSNGRASVFLSSVPFIPFYSPDLFFPPMSKENVQSDESDGPENTFRNRAPWIFIDFSPLKSSPLLDICDRFGNEMAWQKVSRL